MKSKVGKRIFLIEYRRSVESDFDYYDPEIFETRKRARKSLGDPKRLYRIVEYVRVEPPLNRAG